VSLSSLVHRSNLLGTPVSSKLEQKIKGMIKIVTEFMLVYEERKTEDNEISSRMDFQVTFVITFYCGKIVVRACTRQRWEALSVEHELLDELESCLGMISYYTVMNEL